MLLLLSLLLSGEWAKGQQNQAPSEYRLRVEKLVKVQEGLCVLVSCSFSFPKKIIDFSKVQGYWFEKGTTIKNSRLVATSDKSKVVSPRTQERFQLVGDLLKKDCSLMIRDVQKEDSREYYFRMEKIFNNRDFLDGFFLQVEDLTQKPDIFIPETLEPGQPATAFCVFNWTFEQCSVPSFSWRGAAVSSRGTRPHTSHFSVLSFLPEPQHHDTELTCQVDFSRKGLSTQRTIRMNVAYAPKDLVISIFHDSVSVLQSQGNIPYLEDLEVHQGQTLRLSCAADSQPPATLSWVLGDRVLSWSSPLGSRILELELPEVKARDSGHYTCQAENRLGSQQRTLVLSVLYAPEDLRVTVSQANVTVLEILRNDTSLPVLEGQSLLLHCVTSSNPPAKLRWTWESQTLSPTQSSDPGVLELPLVQREHEGEFTCTAQNPLGAQGISLSLSVHYPPQMPRPSCSWEAKGLHCSCSSRAWPAPSLHWRLGEGLLEGNSTNTSFTVTSRTTGPWFNSSLSLHRGLSTNFELSCEAWNTHGAQSATVLLLPDSRPSSTAFSSGVCLGIGVMALFALCLIMILMKIQRKKRTQEKTSRPKILRGSTILEYINVVPKTRSLARNRKAKPSTQSRTPTMGSHSPESRKNQQELHSVSLSCPEPKSSTQAPDFENNPELHYAALSFPRLRPQDTQSDYAEVRFH